jgi:transcriptional regulator of acetoin/glycerol metabolism
MASRWWCSRFGKQFTQPSPIFADYSFYYFRVVPIGISARLHKHLCSSLGSGKFESGDSLEHVNEMARQSQRSRKSKTVRRERHLSRLRKRLGVESLLEIKRKAVQKALTASKGDKVLAAALLGIGKTTLYRSLKK